SFTVPPLGENTVFSIFSASMTTSSSSSSTLDPGLTSTARIFPASGARTSAIATPLDWVALCVVPNALPNVPAHCCRAVDQGGGLCRANGQRKLAQSASLQFDRDQAPPQLS